MSDTLSRLAASIGDRYRVERELGAGGMATVFLAHDLRHQRDVAIKVLHPDIGAALGGERFLTEIRTTARLQHPHILPLLDSGEANGLLFYVMPFVPGETLRARLERERQLPLDDAIALAREVADALQYAHDNGIIHRDIKPDNILLQGGHALVADFGIALAVQQAGGARMTQTGLSLGTPQYMAPEQATGERTIDARADVYALGAVVYEMVTGEPPFTGATSQAVVARLLTVAPSPMREVRNTVPAALEDAVMRALAKLPADRFASARQFAEAMHRSLGTAPATGVMPATTAPRSRLKDPLVLGLGLAALAGTVCAGYLSLRGVRSADPRMTAAVLPLELRNPSNLPFNEIGRSFAIATDGSYVVYVGADPEDPSATLLWRRDLDRLTVAPISGTRNAQSPRISADSKTIYFLARTPNGVRNVLRSIPSAGGTARDVLFQSNDIWIDASGRMLKLDTLTWLVSDLSDSVESGLSGVTPLVRVPPVSSTSPDGTHTLVVVRDTIAMHRIGTPSRQVLAMGAWARFVDDYTILLLTPSNMLMAARLNDDRSALASKPIVVLENVGITPSQRPMFDLSEDGTAIYATGGDVTASRLLWVRRDGTTDSIAGAEARSYTQVRLSPDDRDAAVSIGRALGQGEVWIERLGVNRRVPISDANNGTATWLPDGQTVAYPRTRPNVGWGYTVMSRPAAADRAEDTLSGPWPPRRLISELDFSRDGAQIVRTILLGGVDRDIWGRVDGRSAFFKVAADSGVQERAPRFSPDGKWVSYVSDFTRQEEVYIQPFPGPGGRVQVSTAGGREPVWSRDGKALFYRALDGWMMEVPVNGTLPGFGQPRRLFDASPYVANQFTVQYDVARDGRFLMWKRVAQAARTDVVIIRNWANWVRQQIEAAK